MDSIVGSAPRRRFRRSRDGWSDRLRPAHACRAPAPALLALAGLLSAAPLRAGDFALCVLAAEVSDVQQLAPPQPGAGPVSAAADPVEGCWLGSAGSPRETVAVGLQFRRDAAGELKARITQPVINYFDLELPGIVRRADERVWLPEFGLELRLVDGRLEGSFPGPDSPVRLERVAPLPAEAAPPDVPSGPGPRWQTRLGGPVWASPAVADGVAYVGTTGGVFNALATDDGRYLWTFRAGRPIFGEALVVADAVYFVCDNGYLFKLRRSDGAELWRYDLGDARVERILAHPQVFDWDWQAPRPVLADGLLYVGSGDGSLHAVEATSGTRRWRFATDGKLRHGAAVAGAQVFVGSADGHVYALDRQDGRELWRHDTGAAVDATPVVHEGRVLVGNRGVGLLALDERSGEQRWRTGFWGSWVESTPVVVDGVLYVGASDLRRVSAIDPADGRVLWRSDVFGWTWGTPLVLPDRLVVGAAGGTPYLLHHQASLSTLDRQTGRILQRWPLPDGGGHQWGIAGSPALSGDTIVVATIEGSLLGFPAS